MIFKKATATALCFIQIALGVTTQGAFAMEPASEVTSKLTPEFTLLENVASLQGEILSQQDLKTRLGSLLTQYDETASKDGQTDRLQQAMIDLGMYTPAQAAVFVANARTLATSGADMSTALSQMLATVPGGAQFSGCALGGGILTGVAAFVTLFGLLLYGIAGSEGGVTWRVDTVIIGGGVGMAGGVTLIVLGSEGKC